MALAPETRAPRPSLSQLLLRRSAVGAVLAVLLTCWRPQRVQGLAAAANATIQGCTGARALAESHRATKCPPQLPYVARKRLGLSFLNRGTQQRRRERRARGGGATLQRAPGLLLQRKQVGADAPAPALQVDRTCMGVLPSSRMACGDPTIDECHCEALGCCYGGNDPFTSTLDDQGRIPSCYYLYGGTHGEMPNQFWEVPMNENYNLKIAGVSVGDAASVRLKIVPGDAVCGSPAPCDPLTLATCPVHTPVAAGDFLRIEGLTFNGPGRHTVCMNDSVDHLNDPDDKFFTINVGRISVYEKFADVGGECR